MMNKVWEDPKFSWRYFKYPWDGGYDGDEKAPVLDDKDLLHVLHYYWQEVTSGGEGIHSLIDEMHTHGAFDNHRARCDRGRLEYDVAMIVGACEAIIKKQQRVVGMLLDINRFGSGDNFGRPPKPVPEW